MAKWVRNMTRTAKGDPISMNGSAYMEQWMIHAKNPFRPLFFLFMAIHDVWVR